MFHVTNLINPIFRGVLMLLPSFLYSQGAWNPPGADLSFPRILLDSTSVPVIREILAQPEILSLYKSIWQNANSVIPSGDTTDNERINRAIIAKEDAFVVLMDRKYEEGNIVPLPVENRDSLIARSRWLLENLNTHVGYQGGWVFYQEWQHRSKELINYLTAYDLLLGAGIPADSLQVAKDSLIRFTANLYHRAMATYTVNFLQLKFFTFQFNNHSIMTSSALGLAAILFNDYENPDPDFQPQNWINAGMWNLDNTLWMQGGMLPRVSEPDSLAGYAEGPGYFSYAFQNAFPFIRAMGNFLPDADYPYTFNQVTRQIKTPWYDPRYDQLYEWMNRIRMPDGSMPAIHDSPIGFGTTITALSGKSQYNWSNPSFTPDDPFIRTQYIAAHVAHGPVRDSLFQALPEAGSLVFRSGWDTSAIFLHFIGKHGISLSGAKSHHHGDAGSFSLFAFGKLMAADPGYPGAPESDVVNKPTDHSLVLVNGNGPNPPSGEFVSTITNTCYIENFFDTPELDYGEVNTSYHGAYISRKTLYIRNRYFFLADFLNSAVQNTYTFQLHGNGLSGASPEDPSGRFVPDFDHYKGIYQRDSVKLFIMVLTENGMGNYSYLPDSLATAYGTYRHYSKMLVSNQFPASRTFFLTTLFPSVSQSPEMIPITLLPGVSGTKIKWEDRNDVIFCQQNNGMKHIPPDFSGFSSFVRGNGYINFFSTDTAGNFKTAFLQAGDSILYGSQTIIACDHPMNVAYEKPGPSVFYGYASGPGMVSLYSDQPLRVAAGNIASLTFDPLSRLCKVSFTGGGNFILEPANNINDAGKKYLFKVEAWPNPSSDGRWTIGITSCITAPAKVALFDAEGKTVMQQSFFIVTRRNNLPVDLPMLPAGEYILTIEALGNVISTKLVKY